MKLSPPHNMWVRETCLDDFHAGCFQEREFNAQLLEERRPSLNILMNMKEMGLMASKCSLWRGVCVLKQGGGKKETACKPCTLMEKLYYNLFSPKELMNLKNYTDKSRGHSFFKPNLLIKRQNSPFPLNLEILSCSWWVYFQGWFKPEWLHKWERWAKLSEICSGWICPWNYPDLHSQMLRAGRVQSRFFTASLRASPLGKSFLHISLAVSHHLGNMFQHVTPQKPFGIICVLYKDTVFYVC